MHILTGVPVKQQKKGRKERSTLKMMIALAVAVMMMMFNSFTAQAFLIQPMRVQAQQAHQARMPQLWGKGFQLKYDQESTMSPQERQQHWEMEYKDYIRRNGAQLCALSWRGYEASGRGAVFAKYDFGPSDSQASEVDRFASNPSIYVEMEKWEESGGGDAPLGDKDSLRQILSRLSSYEPEKSFVVVFQAHGLMGADIVTPNISPREMAARLLAEEQESAKQHAAAQQGIITVESKQIEE